MSKTSHSLTNSIIVLISVALAVFQIYTAATIPLTALEQRSVHLGIVIALVFLYDSLHRGSYINRAVDYLLAFLSVAGNLYIFLNWHQVAMRSTALTRADTVFSLLLVGLVLVSTYLMIGKWMPLISVAFLLYACLGPWMPGVFRFRGISLNRALSSICLGSEGIFGSCTGVSATFVFMFLLFGEFLLQYGAGDFIITVAETAFGRFRGASCKIAVLASGFFGMLSGSCTANVAATGTFTIPLMKKSGYSAEYAGSVVAAATTGGLIMPPVMGTSAFIMAEMLGIPYGEVCLIAAIPAVIYFASIFISTDLHAAKIGDLGKKNASDNKIRWGDGWHYLICLGVLVILLCVVQLSAAKACFWSILSLLISDYVRRLIQGKKMNLMEELRRVRDIFVKATKGVLSVATACACAGIIVGVFSATGLNLRFSNMLVSLAGGSQVVLLLLSMVGAIILGMGLPSVSVYILMAIIIAPALIKTGIPPICAHMFLFYFGLMAPITPPVGVAFYVAAGIADGHPMRTGFHAFKLALPGFIMPFVFVYDSALLMQGRVPEILWAVIVCVLGLFALSVAIEGWFQRPLQLMVRLLLAFAAILIILPENVTSCLGIVVLALTLLLVIRSQRKECAL